jgi:integrase
LVRCLNSLWTTSRTESCCCESQNPAKSMKLCLSLKNWLTGFTVMQLRTCDNPKDRIFPISYEAARMMVVKAGKMVGIHLRPHDLRRHAATFASRSGVPIEIISKVILRHANLSTTQRYLGTISDQEAIRWIENIYG